MAHSVFRRLASNADHLASAAAFSASCAAVALRRGVPFQRVLAGLSPSERIVVAHAARGLVESDAAEVAACRHEAIYLAVTVFGRPHRSLARVAGVSHAAINKAVRTVEEGREDEDYDSDLASIEQQLMGAA
jgi:hypothetical protein